MKKLVSLITFAACAALGLFARAAEKPVQLADPRGVQHQPLAAKDARAIVLQFIAPDCPISNAYIPEIKRLTTDYANQQIAFYLVYVDPDLTGADVKKHVDEFGLSATALLDPKHLLVKRTGASVTPQTVVMSPEGTVLYRGRIDDLYLDFGKRQEHPRQRDLRNALDAILAGKPVPVKETKAVGCYIGDTK